MNAAELRQLLDELTIDTRRYAGMLDATIQRLSEDDKRPEDHPVPAVARHVLRMLDEHAAELREKT